MKIAYIVPYVPSLIRARSYNFIRNLKTLGHEVTVFTLGRGKRDFQDVQALLAFGVNVEYHEHPIGHSLWNSVLALPSNHPLQSVYSWSPAFASHIVNVLQTKMFDVVHLEHLRSSRYGTYIKAKLPQIPIVWDSVDCISYLFEQASSQSGSTFGKFVTRFELPRTRKAEARLAGAFEQVVITSDTDKTALLNLMSDSTDHVPVSVIPNGVDLNYFYPNPEIERDTGAIIFTGKMSYHANLSMVKYLIGEIMPRVWAKHPTTHLFVVGKDPPLDIRELGKDSLITVTGTVDDIRPFLWRATISVVPLLYGAGIQFKVLEAMATGTPVVATSRAVMPLQTTVGKNVLIGDTPETFSLAILELLGNVQLRDMVSHAGLDYVQTHHDWNNLTERLADVYRQSC